MRVSVPNPECIEDHDSVSVTVSWQVRSFLEGAIQIQVKELAVGEEVDNKGPA